ncbi:MAG: hypothetical protein J0I17_04335 ['Candidatus Kapabacteria' thiocyanatum]|uniref:Glycosyltransferase RgtA/B/C/D-like domain-containing protein n=1 Tax=Candidatus Kapaibacterium thiocyanatum TaxID=1895771 RepID=A0A1M3L5S5_9BACT|nr:hypothetical protein ['Candidatus Kapabacteria' thiocyanatum]OJX60912.1 MAG: hypothetical protein BGO89_04940 ['Candidatus Kapabacteria' thiocyanatum]
MTTAFLMMVVTILLQLALGLATSMRLRVRLPVVQLLSVSLLLGMFLHTVLVFLIELAGIYLTRGSVLGVAALAAVALQFPAKGLGAAYRSMVEPGAWSPRLYDVVTIAVGCYLMFISVWAAYYWPVTPFDAMAGIDLVARTAVMEGHLNNSIYTEPLLAGKLSNQPFYAPFAMIMQVVYRLIGFPFGQMWLPVLSIAFLAFMFDMLRQRLHGVIAGLLFILLVSIPELYGYSFLVQTDYLNAVFFGIGGLMMIDAIRRSSQPSLWLAALMLAGACWSRTETVFIVIAAVLSMTPWLTRSFDRKVAFRGIAVVIGLSLLSFALWHVLYFRLFLPVHPQTAAEITGFDGARFLAVTSETISDVFGDIGLWGLIWIIGGAVIAGQAIGRAAKKTSFGDVLPVIWMVVTVVALLFVGTMFQSAIVSQTIRRGLFKLFPFMFFYLTTAPVLRMLSERITRWETRRASS